MTLNEAQRELRTVYIGGSVGQLVSGVVWMVSAGLATWFSVRHGILMLVVGGMFIFPLTQLVLRLSGRAYKLSAENPLGSLGMQVAFMVPLTLPVAGGAALHEINWFYPAVLIIVGAHYLPFIFLYGMWQYAAIATVLMAGGLGIGLYGRQYDFAVGGWFGGAVLLLFALAVVLMRSKDTGA